jgi:hypothetical protein
VVRPHETHRFARHAQARLQLRAHRHPFDNTPERLDEKKVALVSPIEAYGAAEETRRDAEAKRASAPALMRPCHSRPPAFCPLRASHASANSRSS